MGDFFIGFTAGALAILALMHLIYQKRITKNGWVAKTEDASKYWLSTFLYSISALAVILYMVYT